MVDVLEAGRGSVSYITEDWFYLLIPYRRFLSYVQTTPKVSPSVSSVLTTDYIS